MGEINAPVLVERLSSINDFYNKIIEKNPNASAENIVAFIQLFPDVCIETWGEFKSNWENNLLLTAYPFYLKGDISPLKNELEKLDEILAGKYKKDDGWQMEAGKRKKMTDILLDQVSID